MKAQSFLLCAIFLLKLVLSKTTTEDDDFEYEPAPKPGQPDKVPIPSRTITYAKVAVFSDDTPVEVQWEQNNSTVTMAWDFTDPYNLCYAEVWRTNENGVELYKSYCNNQSVIYNRAKLDKCQKRRAVTTSTSVYKNVKTKWSLWDIFSYTAQLEDSQATLKTTFHEMSTAEQLVNDPFQRSRNEKLVLWSTRNESLVKQDKPIKWLWLNSSSNDIIYMQMYKDELGSDMVYYYEQGFQGLSTKGVGDYWFHNFLCN